MNASGTIREHLPAEQIAVVLTHEGADLADSLYEIRAVRPRQAIRVTRILFENLITLFDVQLPRTGASWRPAGHIVPADERDSGGLILPWDQ